MNVKARIMRFIEYKNLNKARFQQSIGVSAAYLNNMSHAPGVDVQQRISEMYPELNMSWLMHGEGDMLNEGIVPTLQRTINLVPLSGQGGRISDFINISNGCETMVSPTEHADVAVYVTDDSMSPLLQRGQRAVLQKTNADAFIAWGNVYVIDTNNGMYIRRIYQAEDGSLLLKSCNEYFPDFTIKRSHVNAFYRILATINVF